MELNEYSQNAFNLLKACRPDLVENITIAHCVNFGGHYFEFEVVSPNPNVKSNLFFSTEGERLTVGFDEFHCHSGSFYGCIFVDELKNAMETINRIRSEELIEAVYFQRGRVIATALLKRNDPNKLELGLSDDLRRRCDKVDFISWSGLYDATREVRKSGFFK